jgi:hypothetical protein
LSVDVPDPFNAQGRVSPSPPLTDYLKWKSPLSTGQITTLRIIWRKLSPWTLVIGEAFRLSRTPGEESSAERLLATTGRENKMRKASDTIKQLQNVTVSKGQPTRSWWISLI